MSPGPGRDHEGSGASPPHHVLGRRSRRAGAGPEPDPGQAPGFGPPQDVTRQPTSCGRADHQQHVARAGTAGAGNRRDIGPVQVHRERRPFADDDGVDEFDGYVAAVRPPLRGATHHMVAPAANCRARDKGRPRGQVFGYAAPPSISAATATRNASPAVNAPPPCRVEA